MPIPIKLEEDNVVDKNGDDDENDIIFVNSFETNGTNASYEIKVEPTDDGNIQSGYAQGLVPQTIYTGDDIHGNASTSNATYVEQLKILYKPNGDTMSGNLPLKISNSIKKSIDISMRQFISLHSYMQT